MQSTNRECKQKVTCAWCEGTGKWLIAPGTRAACVVCGGSGRVNVSGPARQCIHCHGTGNKASVRPCLVCAGTGWEAVAEN